MSISVKRILKQEMSVDELFKAVDRLQIISITLDPADDPQLIFESLNSTGLALTEGDKNPELYSDGPYTSKAEIVL